MKISHNWLTAYLDLNISADEIARILTDTGLEVEKYHSRDSVPGIIGEVLSKEKHPNADRLAVTSVRIGKDSELQIVCGAPNVSEGQKVVVVEPGTTITTDSGDPIEIKSTKIRGIESNGMICSESELGIGDNHDGILVLEEDAPVGLAADSYFKIETDTQYEIGLTPNRADGMSHIGVARDLLCALKHQQLADQGEYVNWPSVDEFKIDSHDVKMNVVVKDPDKCPRYAGIAITGVNVAPSPTWLQNRLRSIDLKPINNVVDATNFVLHEIGQPLHAFDLSKIKNNKVMVQTLPGKTKFTSLDAVERELDQDDLIICNENEGMCIAGVFGGLKHGVSENTKDIFLESAYFNPVSIRKSAKRHGLNTDASYRFERGIDPDKVVYALKRAALLIQEVAGGSVASELIDLYPKKLEPFKTQLDLLNLNSVAGTSIEAGTVRNILNWLDIEITAEKDTVWQLQVPAYRVDVKREIDVIEEVLRIFGFNNIPLPEKINASLSYSTKPDREKLQNIVSDLLSNSGYSEIMANSLTKGEYVNMVPTDELNPKDSITMLNPLSSDLSVLRQTLLFSGLESIAHNLNRQESNLKIYEFGKGYAKKDGTYKESSLLSVLLTGSKADESWNTNQEEVSYYSIMGAVSSVLNRLGVSENRELKEKRNGVFDEGSELLIEGVKIAEIGKVKKEILEKTGIKQTVFFAELQWDIILEGMNNHSIAFQPMAKYPSVRRDFSLLLNSEISFSEIVEIANKAEGQLLKEVGLFDVYEGKGLPPGKKSYAVKFVLQDENATLNDNRIEQAMATILKQLEKKLGASLR